LLVAVGSATQDIALDAYRIESADPTQQAALAASYQTGYRLAMIWAGAGVLWVAAWVQGDNATGYVHAAWQAAYFVMAASMLVGCVTVLMSKEPVRAELPPARNIKAWLQGALVEPFADFMKRYKWQAVLILSLIAVYRIMTLLGAFIGGVIALRWGVMRILMLGAVLSALSNLLFAWLSGHGHDVTALIAVVSADNLASGIASAAFIAYLSSLTNVQYSATQYALLSSMMLLLPKFIAGFSGDYVNAHGYANFFTATAWLGLPVLVLVGLAWYYQAPEQDRLT
jgi:PAT family beta-lactamase induction signal transducer AmpG